MSTHRPSKTTRLVAPIALRNNMTDRNKRVKFTIHGLGDQFSDNRTVDALKFRSVSPGNSDRVYRVTAFVEDYWASRIGEFVNEVRARSGEMVVASESPDEPGKYLLELQQRSPHEPSTPHQGPKKILFAHGMKFWEDNGTKDWDHFSRIAEKRGWRVYRTQVPGNGSIADRATRLATYIIGLEAEGGEALPENCLKVVGHSAGGLDLRYIVAHSDREPFRSAAQKIAKVYTIATPHKGVIHNPGGTPILDDLHYWGRAEFNRLQPFSRFRVPTSAGSSRQLPFLAFTFMKSNTNHVDGEVYEISQVWDDAPSYGPLLGHHSGDSPESELRQDGVLEMILDDRIR